MVPEALWWNATPTLPQLYYEQRSSTPAATPCWKGLLWRLRDYLSYVMFCIFAISMSLCSVLVFGISLHASTLPKECKVVVVAILMLVVLPLALGRFLSLRCGWGMVCWPRQPTMWAPKRVAPAELVDFEVVCPEAPCVEDGICVICLDDLRLGEPSRRPCCGHAFHTDCIDSWWLRQLPTVAPRCPTCRGKAAV